jgi:hypothetical protein
VTADQFALTWMTLWLLFYIHYLYLDVCTAFFPLPLYPFILLTWIILNIISIISPFVINPSFHRWAYALPANEAYTILQDIWSRGAVPRLHRALPVLFVWWIVGLDLAAYGHVHRCHKAWHQDAVVKKLTRRASAAAAAGGRGKPLRDDDDGGSGGVGPPNLPSLSLRTPSETLLEVAEAPIAPPLALWRSLVESPSAGSESLRTDDQTATSGREYGELDLLLPLRLWKPFDQSLALSYSYRSIGLHAGSAKEPSRKSEEVGRLYEDEASTVAHEEE